MGQRSCASFVSTIVCYSLVNFLSSADAATPAGSDAASPVSDAPATQPTTTTQLGAGGDVDEVVINGIRRGDLILPTTVTSTSAYAAQ